ncbi:hypothetical protein [Actinomadura sp. 7K507]|uniref:hypothetical protein n=1 Tax=Actinomadura sp. 7K507 TaxID=2530365 RepID=UPI001044BE0D|nr:hypothetical protein [Actinomadura sp. 7K507]TDC97822.1 hypothetical protein E1285_02225 [Actinomadura sp. 7K507]
MTSTPATPADAPAAPAARARHPERWLAACALFYGLTHHIGFGLAGLGTVGDTRWADWVDILTPYAVLLTAAAALHTGQADRRSGIVFLVGAITYVEGHGIHLAANSVGNDTPGIPVVHLWDEVAGHYIWYAGLALVFAALARTLAHRPAPPWPLALVLALTVALTWTTNSLEGGTALMGLIIAAAFTAWGLRTRHHLGRILIPAFAPAAVALAVWGIWHRGFPQPTDLGWL